MERFRREGKIAEDKTPVTDAVPVRELMHEMGGQAQEFLSDDRDERVTFRGADNQSLKKLTEMVMRHT
jgi:hypothetical protein